MADSKWLMAGGGSVVRERRGTGYERRFTVRQAHRPESNRGTNDELIGLTYVGMSRVPSYDARDWKENFTMSPSLTRESSAPIFLFTVMSVSRLAMKRSNPPSCS